MQYFNKFYLTTLAILFISFSTVKGQEIGQEMPDFQLFGMEGDLIRLSNMKDKYVLVNFAQPNCPEYITVHPQLIALERKYSSKEFTNANGFEVINISLENDDNVVRQAISKYGGGVRYETMLPQMYEAKVVKDYGVTAPITRFLLGPGNRFLGKNLSFSDIDQLLESNQMVEEMFYRVFLAIFPINSEIFHQYTHISHLGQIYKEKNNTTTIASYLGTYYNYDDALYARDHAIEAGYHQAQIVTYRNNLIDPELAVQDRNDYENNPSYYTSRSIDELPFTPAPAHSDLRQPQQPVPSTNPPVFVPPKSYKEANPNWQKNDPATPDKQMPSSLPSNSENAGQKIIFKPPPADNNNNWQNTTPTNNTAIDNQALIQETIRKNEIAGLEEQLKKIEERMDKLNAELLQLLEESRFIREELNRKKAGY